MRTTASLRRTLLAGAACVLTAATLMTTGCGGGAATPATTTDAATTTQAADTRTVTDSDGNEVTIPSEVTRVAPTIGAFAQVTEMLAPGEGKIVAAATQQLQGDFQKVFSDYAESNANGYDTGSVEDIVASGAQVVYGPKSAFSDEQLQQLEAAGIAFVNLSNIGTVEGMEESIQTIGDILGGDAVDNAKEFVDYYEAGMKDASDRAAKVPEDQRATALPLNVQGGAYTTTTKTDISEAYYEAAGITNVAADYESASQGQGTTVDAEQIAAWNPQYIVAFNAQAAETIRSDAALANVDAVKNGHVLVCPKGLYLWCVRSGEGALMSQWLGSQVYPDQYGDFSMTATLQDFYERFYHAELSDDDAQAIVSGATNTSQGAPAGKGGK